MSMRIPGKWTYIKVCIMTCLPMMAEAQPAKTPFHRGAYTLNSGLHDGSPDPSVEPFVAFRGVVQVPGAPWLRLQFHDCSLAAIGWTQKSR